MSENKAPGVYVQEILSLPLSVFEVATAVPAFIGYTERAEEAAPGDLRLVPKKVQTLLEYQKYFGFPQAESESLSVSFNGSGAVATIDETKRSNFLMHYS